MKWQDPKHSETPFQDGKDDGWVAAGPAEVVGQRHGQRAEN